ncbi:MAG: 4-(cytidine 5'-diphospho)-2-C-methyl-D-erythritol kinase [Bacteroidota bacterium]
MLELRALAKINLGLEVIRRRPDGYHDINTIFAAVDLHDTISLRPRADGDIHCRVEGNDSLASDRNNLCVRAAEALRRATGCLHGLDILLRKRIPMGAGLGGGSSDAATVLKGAAAIWEINPGHKILHELAVGLGSDVPFFLGAPLAVAGSRGEELRGLEMNLPHAILLVNPGIHVATPWAYGAINRTSERPASDLTKILQRVFDDPALLAGKLVNDFEPAVFAEHPGLRMLKERLYGSGAFFALMSGTGSTMFGLFHRTEDALRAATSFPDCWHAVTRFAAREE